VIGDHVKTNIGCRLMPGTYVGFCCALLGGAIPPRFIPSFSFWTDEGLKPFDLTKAKQVMTGGLQAARSEVDGCG
jgi:hypothetical protein